LEYEKQEKIYSRLYAQVAIEAIKEQKSLSELSSQYKLEASLISKWKREFLEKSAFVFNLEEPRKESEKETEKLYEKIGRLEVMIDFLKKKL
jgi:transposase-like protein